MKTPTIQPEAQQSQAQPTPAAAPPQPLHPSLPPDEFHGVAGSYLFDPATGRRTPMREADHSQN